MIDRVREGKGQGERGEERKGRRSSRGFDQVLSLAERSWGMCERSVSEGKSEGTHRLTRQPK